MIIVTFPRFWSGVSLSTAYPLRLRSSNRARRGAYPVTFDYEPPFKFTGEIEKVVIEVSS